MWGSDAKM